MSEPQNTPRQPRAEAVAEERRRRKTEVTGDPTLDRFSLPAEALDLEKYSYRAVPDVGNRLFNLTQRDDYDFVTTKGASAREASDAGVVRYRSGNNLDGGPAYTYLLRKPKKFADEDRAAKIAKIDADEKARLKRVPKTDASKEDQEQFYIPKG